MGSNHRRRFLRLSWRSPERIRADVDEELAFDLDMRAKELTAQGLEPAEARRVALEEFGDLEATRRACAASDRVSQRSTRRAEWLGEVRQDVRLALRGAVRAPGFTLVVLATLALGIGANTAVFSVMRKVLLERLPYREPGRLVRLYGGSVTNPGARSMLTAAEISELQGAPELEAVAPFGYYGGYTWVGEERAEVWGGVRVGPGFFRMLGVSPLLGRGIGQRDLEPEAPPVVVLGHALWQREFGGDPTVVGRAVRLNGREHVVVGVMPPEFVSPERDPEIWTPLDLQALLRDHPAIARHGRMLRAVGRVRAGVDAARLRSALEAFAGRARADDPERGDAVAVRAVSLSSDMVGEVRPVLLIIMGAAALVLVLACANLAGLFLSRAASHRRHMAVRAALGARRERLVRQLLTESTVLALAGGALGIPVAFWVRNGLVDVTASLLPSMRDAPLDAAVLAFTAVLAVLTALAFGALPALTGTRLDLADSLAGTSRRVSGGAAASRTRHALVGAQVGLAVLLSIAAGLLGRTLVALHRTGVGFDTGSAVLTFRVNLMSERYAGDEVRARFFEGFAGRIRTLPGVRAIGTVDVSPWNGYTAFGPDSFAVVGRPSRVGGADLASRVTASVGYFGALRIPVIQGRAFTSRDRAGSPLVALVNRSLAEEYWADASPVGAGIRVGGAAAPPLQVVGVVGDVRPSPDSEVTPTVYVPVAQHPPGGAEFVVRAGGDARTLVPAIRRALHEEDPALPLVAPRGLAEVLAAMLAGQRLPLLFMSAFAGLALLLASLGVYGVMAYSVTARRRELGVRIALGSSRGAVLALALKEAVTVALAGMAAGLLVALVGVRLLRGL
ncbi:MAG TPA: ABC transporter permease, partial [Actinomycetota bacterium]|nr:ABC transporter permease [Actinomycetota bacterium]